MGQGIADGLVSPALAPFQENRRERFLIEGPGGIILDSKISLGVAMMLHELATNAVKYGALSNDSGRISVHWESDAAEKSSRVTLHWKERGGPPVAQPERRGFGSPPIEQAFGNDSANARVSYDPRGVECSIEVELAPFMAN